MSNVGAPSYDLNLGEDVHLSMEDVWTVIDGTQQSMDVEGTNPTVELDLSAHTSANKRSRSSTEGTITTKRRKVAKKPVKDDDDSESEPEDIEHLKKSDPKTYNRIMRNRLSAAQSRQRKKALMDTLQTRVTEQDKQIKEYRLQLSAFGGENEALKQEVQFLRQLLEFPQNPENAVLLKRKSSQAPHFVPPEPVEVGVGVACHSEGSSSSWGAEEE